jgi:hypothetical protein
MIKKRVYSVDSWRARLFDARNTFVFTLPLVSLYHSLAPMRWGPRANCIAFTTLRSR